MMVLKTDKNIWWYICVFYFFSSFHAVIRTPYVCLCVCTYMYIYTHTYMYTYAHTYKHMENRVF